MFSSMTVIKFPLSCTTFQAIREHLLLWRQPQLSDWEAKNREPMSWLHLQHQPPALGIKSPLGLPILHLFLLYQMFPSMSIITWYWRVLSGQLLHPQNGLLISKWWLVHFYEPRQPTPLNMASMYILKHQRLWKRYKLQPIGKKLVTMVILAKALQNKEYMSMCNLVILYVTPH